MNFEEGDPPWPLIAPSEGSQDSHPLCTYLQPECSYLHFHLQEENIT